jgi:hypothetical protein
MARARLAAGLVLLAGALRLVVGHGLVNYDTLYALVWGRDLAHGRLPDYDIALAPTPHPLATLLGVALTPLSDHAGGGVHGQAATSATLLLAFLALAALGWVVYRLGAAWFHPAVGVLAAAIVLTRRPVLDFGARAYVDLPYLVLVLGAVLVETRRPRAGAPVLALLAVAGLIRPEAWLFSAAYLLWVRDWRLLPLAAAGPVLWALGDLAVTGDPLHSLTGTRDNAATLQRVTGLQHVPLTVPRRIGEILREPVLLGAAGGGVLSLLWLRSRVALGAAVGVLGLVAFCVLAAAGLPILGRYLLLPATILAIFGAAGVLGWLALDRRDPRRRPWQAFGALTVLVLLAFAPSQVHRIHQERDALRIQQGIQSDLAAIVGHGHLADACRPVTVPNRRPIPLLALWLGEPPTAIRSAQDGPPRRGADLATANAQVAHDYILDPRDLDRRLPPPPASFARRAHNASWVLRTAGCSPAG